MRHQHWAFTPRKRRAFTLIELLIVIAIVSLLAAILFPIFGQAREKARQTQCLSSVRQIALATLAYTQDYDERLPGAYSAEDGTQAGNAAATPGEPCRLPDGSLTRSRGVVGGWTYFCEYSRWTRTVYDPAQGTLAPYTRSAALFRCASDASGQGNAYGINRCLLTRSVTPDRLNPGIGLAAFRAPASTVLFAEGAENYTHRGSDDGLLNMGASTDPDARTGNPEISARHAGGSCFAFADGHARWLNPAQIPPALIDQSGNLVPGAHDTSPVRWEP